MCMQLAVYGIAALILLRSSRTVLSERIWISWGAGEPKLKVRYVGVSIATVSSADVSGTTAARQSSCTTRASKLAVVGGPVPLFSGVFCLCSPEEERRVVKEMTIYLVARRRYALKFAYPCTLSRSQRTSYALEGAASIAQRLRVPCARHALLASVKSC